MLTAWVIDTLETEYHLLHGVIGKEVPRILLHSKDIINPSQTDDVATALALHLLTGCLYLVGGMAKRAIFLMQEGVSDTLIAVGCKAKLLLIALIHVLLEQAPALCLVLRAKHFLEDNVLFWLLSGRSVFHIASYKEENSEDNSAYHEY